MKTLKRTTSALAAAAIAAVFAIPAQATNTALNRPSNVAAKSAGNQQGKDVYPPTSPSSVNESAPATTGKASTPTHGQGQSAAAPKQEGMNRLPKTPSSGGREPAFHAQH